MANNRNYELRKLFDSVVKKVLHGSIEEKQAFLDQNRNLFNYPVEQILFIHSQNSRATMLKTYEEWAQLNRRIEYGEKAVQTMEDYTNPESKRQSYFDISQTVGAKMTFEAHVLRAEELSFALQELEDYQFEKELGSHENLYLYVDNLVEQHLRGYQKLNGQEKELSKLIAYYTLEKQIGLVTNDETLYQIDKLLSNHGTTIQLLNTVKIANNLSGYVLSQLQTTRDKAIEMVEKQKNKAQEVTYFPLPYTKSQIVEFLSDEGALEYIEPVYQTRLAVNLEETIILELTVFPDEHPVELLEETKAPWQLEIMEYNHNNLETIGTIAYGEDWSTEFVIDEEIEDVLENIHNLKNGINYFDEVVVNQVVKPRVVEIELDERKSVHKPETLSEEEIQQFTQEELKEALNQNYPVDETKSYNHARFLNWTKLRNEEINRNKEITLFDDLVEGYVPSDDDLFQAGTEVETILQDNPEFLDFVLEDKHRIFAEWSGGLNQLILQKYSIEERTRQTYVTLDLTTGQFVEKATFLENWSNKAKADLLEKLCRIMKIEPNAKYLQSLKTSKQTSEITVLDYSFPTEIKAHYPKTTAEKINKNIEAIQLVKKLESTNTKATFIEQEKLSKYVGWGGLANIFLDTRNERFEVERQELKTLITPKEYEQIEQSSLTAYYTEPELIKSIWKKLELSGFKGGRVLDPEMGTGNFFAAMPEDLKKHSELVGVELDSLTGAIAKNLQQSANIRVQGFETVNFSDNSFDVVIGNVPFADIRVSDSTYENILIHDYFFQKSMDLVRPGGILAFITSTGTMDKKDPRTRENLAKKGKLIAGYRLPETAFKTIAGTDVTTDILFFQKTEQHQTEDMPLWTKGAPSQELPNPYFEENPQNVLGDFTIKNFHGQTLSVKESNDSSYLEKFENTTLDLTYSKGQLDDYQLSISKQPQSLAPYTFGIENGKVYYQNGNTKERRDVSKRAMERLSGLIHLKEAALSLIQLQKFEGYSLVEFERAKNELNKVYDRFIEQNGFVHNKGNRLVFREDDFYPFLCSLEIEKEDGPGEKTYKKAEIFHQPTIRPIQSLTHVDNALDALHMSFNLYQKVDLEYMQEIYSKELSDILEELQGEIYLNHKTGEYEITSEYLSGDVKTKLSEINDYVKEGNIDFLSNQKALESVQPVNLSLTDIHFRLGTPWIPQDFYKDFIKDTFELTPFEIQKLIKLDFDRYHKSYFLSNKKSLNNHLIKNTFGTKRKNALELLEECMNFKNSVVEDTIEVEGKDKRVVNPKETLFAREKQELIRQTFNQWIFNSKERTEILETIYNSRYNRNISRQYDGSQMIFPSLNPSIELRPHQKNAVQRIVNEGRALLAHVVGSGKTLTMIAAGMKLKELGLVQKPLFVVPKNLVTNFGEEILRAYPDKKVLVATEHDFKKERRKQFVSRIATGTYDAIVMGHTQFGKIKMSDARVEKFMRDEIASIVEMLAKSNENSHSFKQLQSTKMKLEKRLEESLKTNHKDKLLDFEELGVDCLFVDEAHGFKNLRFDTKLSSVAGVTTGNAQKAMDMLLKVRYLQEENNQRGVIFATGTPISNSMCEMYTVMRYLEPDVLEDLGLTHFDDWQGVFGEIENKMEMTPEASGYRIRNRFAKFHNLPELMTQFHQVADIQTQDMLDLPVPKHKNILIETKATLAQQMKMDELALRAEQIRLGMVSPVIDNMLKVTHEARYMALDPRLLDNKIYEAGDSKKLEKCAQNVGRIYHQTANESATQMIFSDIGVPKASTEHFSAYQELKALLIQKEIPQEQIAFIHDAKTDAQKDALFEKIRNGETRIIIGSTEKLGTGVNVQDKLIAAHHLDCPWRPSDIEQRNGRIIRQGNQFDEVEIYTYITSGTFDSYLWQIQEQKLSYITQIMSSKAATRSTDEVDEIVLEASEVKALTTGNPLLKERADLENTVNRLKLLQSAHSNEQQTMKRDLQLALKNLPLAKQKLEMIIADKTNFSDHSSQNFELIIDEKLYTEEDKKTEVGQKLFKKITEVRMEASNLEEMRKIKIGEFKGFSLYFDGFVQQSNDYSIRVEGKMDHFIQVNPTSSLGAIQRLGKFEEKLNTQGHHVQKEIVEYETQINHLQNEIGTPFEKFDELKEKSIELSRIDQAIQLNISLEELDEMKQQEPSDNSQGLSTDKVIDGLNL
ncbi:MAG: DEAD/DEAH box helicase family protein [Streptococcaceae bacterium]|jgi:N12 class adenine-specific DNA methylase|nr:DEAD/DEAH box helicase family protein [Streptococcaceae bacterium]